VANIIQAIFCNPPIAIARLGGSTTPAAAFAWAQPPNPRADGNTVAVPQWSLGILTDGSVDPFLPETITFRDGDLIRPVCPFIEIWAKVGAAGSAAETWQDVPLTPALLGEFGADESALRFRIDARNAKAARRRSDPNLVFGTFPPVEIQGDQHLPVVLNAVSPPRASPRMIPPDRSIPLGSVQVLRSRVQPPANSAPWVALLDVEIIRLRFTPGPGRFYGPPRSAQPTNASTVPAVQEANAFLNPAAGWYNKRGDANSFVEPGDTFDEITEGSARSLGVVDDTCEARVEVELQLAGPPKRILHAHANIFCAPPDFGPDRRPFLSLADELNDREANAAARNGSLTREELDAWVEDLFERIYETVSLLNVDALRAGRSIKLSGARLADAAIPEDGVTPVDRALGSQDALRNRTLRIAAASDDDPLPISHHARERHRSLSDIQLLKDLVAADPNRLGALVRGPFEVESGETADRTSMRMPPFMRQSNAFPLTLAAWQYELLMRWVGEMQRPPVVPAAAAAAQVMTTGAPELTEASARRRDTILRRLGGG
jgi:hypothetical protein